MNAMKVLIASGAFKHSLTARDACAAIQQGLVESGLDARFQQLPIADGGNGTLDAFLAHGGQRLRVPVLDPLQRPIQAEYGLIANGQTAVIEMALASGLELLQPHELDPLAATTYGTGQLMADAFSRGVQRIIIGMGGSATIDGGMGCLQALGIRLLDAKGREIPRGGGGLAALHSIDSRALPARWQDVEIIIASDVENPPLGKSGAAQVFGPQKGADAAMVAQLEQNLRHCFTRILEQRGIDLRQLRGGGAAGAFAAGLMAFFGCQIVPGIELVLANSGFAEALADSALLITGEGQLDSQTLAGKGPIGAARLAQQHGVPVIALAGSLNIDEQKLPAAGIQAAFAIVDKPMPLNAALDNAHDLLRRAARRLGCTLQIRIDAP